MNQNEITVTFGDCTMSFSENERIWGILYKLYHEQIDKLLLRFEEALRADINAVGKVKLISTKTALNTKDKSVDLTPFAADLRHRIREYREEHDYESPDMVLFEITEAFESLGEKILKEVFESGKYGLSYVNLSERMEKFELKYHTSTWQALDLDLNLNYCEWEEYQSCLRKIVNMGKDIKTDCRMEALEALRSFPFERSLYKYIYREFGDFDGNVTELAKFLGLDVTDFKLELLNEYVSSLPIANKDNEDELKQQLQKIEDKKQFLGCSCLVPRESEIKKRLQELDIIQRTVKGRLYGTREEAQKVEDDYESLNCMIKEIDFDSYNLSEQDEISKIIERVLSGDFKSDTFKNDKNYIMNELEPVLQHQSQKQTWKNQLYQSREPWKTVEEIIRSSDILPEYKDKFKYWDFDGLKKYFPKLMEYERPVLFFKLSLFGWSDYFVLTNKRGLHIEKDKQREILISSKTVISYDNGQLLLSNRDEADKLPIFMKYPENGREYFLDVFNLIVGALQGCDDILFTMPEGVYQYTNDSVSAREKMSKQIKEVYQDKFSKIFKTVRQPESVPENSRGNVLEKMQTDEKITCSNCGKMLEKGTKFCNFCGEAVRE